MDAAEISYRVADFLKKYAPFQAVGDEDLLALAARGRVRFFEPNQYLLWQGEPHKALVFVIQQGTVSLWDEAGEQARLRDVRGAGDMLGLERYNDARSCLYSARSESDVVVYGFPAGDFEEHVLKYPHAAQYVAAEGRATPDYQPAGGRPDPHSAFLHDFVGRTPFSTCKPHDSLATAARALLSSRSGAVAVIGDEGRAKAVLTAETLLTWIAEGGGDARQPIGTITPDAPTLVAPDISVADGVLLMAASGRGALAITADGTPDGRVQALVTPRVLDELFGEQPAELLGELRRATTVQELRDLNRRARAFTLECLTGASSVEWLARFTHLVDVATVTRLISLSAAGHAGGCWCFCGSSGRRESLTRLAPLPLVILGDEDDAAVAKETYDRVVASLEECGYLPRQDLPFESSFHIAPVGEWKTRYRDWVRDPVRQRTYRARSLFDLQPVLGRRSLWEDVERTAMDEVNDEVVHVLANDCVASLPPLTFFQDAVIDSDGEHSATFQLDFSALRPLVDVGRVFGLAARQVFGRSTLERFATARTLLPEHEAIFREASDTLRIVLWQQGRVGISQGTSGAVLPPALLSRHDRQVLKGGFRSILRLLEFTAAREWLNGLL